MKDYIENRIKEMREEKESEKMLKRWGYYGQAGRFLQGLGVGIVLMSAVGWFAYSNQKSNLTNGKFNSDCKEAQDLAWNKGKEAGALFMVNEDRKESGLKPYATWEEVVASTKGHDEFMAEMNQMIKDRETAEEKYKVKKSWAKK